MTQTTTAYFNYTTLTLNAPRRFKHRNLMSKQNTHAKVNHKNDIYKNILRGLNSYIMAFMTRNDGHH